MSGTFLVGDDDGSEPVAQHAALLVLRVGAEDDYLPAVAQLGPETHALVVCQVLMRQR